MKHLAVAVTDEDHCKGLATAELTLVEYGDFQCPDAGSAYPVVKKLQRHFGKRMRFVFRNFPLTEIHPMAEPAAEAAEFAATQGKFWEMHDALYENQDRLSVSMLGRLAESVGMDGDAANEAVENGEFSERIEQDAKGGAECGVHGTPTFFINGAPYEGEWVFADLLAAMEGAE